MFPLFIGMPGGMELVIILGIAVLLFGADKLPKLARSSGQAMGEFRKGREQIESELRAAGESSDGNEDAEALDADAVGAEPVDDEALDAELLDAEPPRPETA